MPFSGPSEVMVWLVTGLISVCSTTNIIEYYVIFILR